MENPKKRSPIFFLGQVLTRCLTVWGRIGNLPKGRIRKQVFSIWQKGKAKQEEQSWVGVGLVGLSELG